MKLLKLLILPFTITYSLLHPPSLKSLSIKNSEILVDNWINEVKQTKLDFHTLFPLYGVSYKIHTIKNSNSSYSHYEKFCLVFEYNLFIGKPSQLVSADSYFTSHLCICTLCDNKILKIDQICLNPELMINDEKLFIQSSVRFKEEVEKFAGKRNYKVDWSEMLKWDNGRYFLLINEDKFLC